MKTLSFKQKLSLVYLCLVPLIVVAIGFGIGHVNYKIYLPVWLINACLMITAAWNLGGYHLKSHNREIKQQVITALLLFTPWLLFSIFAGMGPPPATLQGWVNTAAEQQVRYTILIAGGILFALGSALLKVKLQAAGENLYSAMASAAINISLPLFIINMAFWGYYLTDAFRIFILQGATKRPDWYGPVKSLFYVISIAEVLLMYLGTVFFAVSLKVTGLFNPVACRYYIIFGLAGMVLVVLPPSWPEPFGTAGYLVAIPAIPFIMPYLIGVHLLKHTKN
jgi:cation transport ATPase